MMRGREGDLGVVEGGTAAHVGLGLRGEPVDVAGVGAEFGPPDGGGEQGSGDDVGGNAGAELDSAVLVLEDDSLAVVDVAGVGVVGMYPHQGFFFAVSEALEVGEGGVEEVVGGWGDEGEWGVGGWCAVGGLWRLQPVGRRPGWQGRVAVVGHLLAIKLAFAIGGRKAAGKGGVGLGQIETDKAFIQQALPGDGLHGGVGLAGQEVLQEGGVILPEVGIGEAHGPGKATEDFAVGQALAHRGDGGTVEREVGVSVGFEDVPVFELGGGGQQVVGVVCGVGLEVFEDDGKQVFASQTGVNGVLIRRHRGGVAVVDDEGFDGRAGLCGCGAGVDGPGGMMGAGAAGGIKAECVAQANHVEGAGLLAVQKVGAFEGGFIQMKGAAAAEQDASAWVTPVADQRGQCGDVPHGHATGGVALQAIVDADGSGPGRCVGFCQGNDALGGDSGDVLGPRGCKISNMVL